MSTGWITKPPVQFDDLRRSDLGDVYVAEVDGTTNDQFALTDGHGFLWAHRHPDLGIATYTSWVDSMNGDSLPTIQEAVSEKFGVEWFSEHDDEFHDDDDDDGSSRLSSMALRVAGFRS
jgi:hypothetical protein